jgi:phosphoribosylanthranilate isomerase
MIRIKICGMMRPEDVRLCAACGADALGFVVEYPVEVPWNLTALQAALLMEAAPPNVTRSMVTGGGHEKICALARRVRPHVVQLHGEETLAETAHIAKALHGEGIRVIKALRTCPDGGLLFEEPDPVRAAGMLEESGVAGILIDSGSAERPGGSGVLLNTETYGRLAAATRLPVIMAGGLRPENIAAVLAGIPKPYAVDVLSGVEDMPGGKNADKVRTFIQAVRGASHTGGEYERHKQ